MGLEPRLSPSQSLWLTSCLHPWWTSSPGRTELKSWEHREPQPTNQGWLMFHKTWKPFHARLEKLPNILLGKKTVYFSSLFLHLSTIPLFSITFFIPLLFFPLFFFLLFFPFDRLCWKTFPKGLVNKQKYNFKILRTSSDWSEGFLSILLLDDFFLRLKKGRNDLTHTFGCLSFHFNHIY